MAYKHDYREGCVFPKEDYDDDAFVWLYHEGDGCYAEEYSETEYIIRRTEVESIEEREILDLKNYLNETDKFAIKCAELELKMSEEYPELFLKRKEARARINELEEKLKENK